MGAVCVLNPPKSSGLKCRRLVFSRYTQSVCLPEKKHFHEAFSNYSPRKHVRNPIPITSALRINSYFKYAIFPKQATLLQIEQIILKLAPGEMLTLKQSRTGSHAEEKSVKIAISLSLYPPS